MGSRKKWFGHFLVARKTWGDGGQLGYKLIGELDDGREVELFISRDRLESMVIDLVADSDLFRGLNNPNERLSTSNNRSATNRLRILAQLGVPPEDAYRWAGIPQPESSSA